ncbi:MAG TPA: hypothetical protein VG738_07840 [Chitinophagaceae bacterium]|nr:hypothetical protein [Chitinophagaceae bacterium]
MQKNIFLAIGLCGCGFTMKGQGDNTKMRYVANRTQDLDAKDMVKTTRDEKITVEVTKTRISIKPANDRSKTLTGTFTDVNCLWKDAFVAGKTIIDTRLVDDEGDDKPVTITIEGVNGEITILLEAKTCPVQKLRLLVDKHEELN